jgi:peptidoglycan hydrolase CwlO-like protein
MAQARQVLEAAEAQLAQLQQHKERLRADIQEKDKEVQQLNSRWVQRRVMREAAATDTCG